MPPTPPPATAAADLVVVIDVGSSGAKMGAVRGDDVAGPMRLPRADGRAVRDVAGPMLEGRQAVIAITGSDTGKVETLAWEVRKLRLGDCVEIGPDHRGIPAAKVERPERAGVDRRLQVLGAARLASGPVAVVSCGTALTVDLGDAGGALLGGAILPGVGLGARALATGTARLPEVEGKGEVGMPARDTEIAIRTGLRVGLAGAVERLLEEGGVGDDAAVFATGQDAELIVPHLRRAVRKMGGLGIFGAAIAVRAVAR